MNSPRTRRLVRTSAVALLLVISSAVLSMTLALRASAAGPGITATPNAGLADGQFVKLGFTGFQPSQSVVLRLCIAHPVNPATDCTSTNTLYYETTDSTGAGTTYLPVYSGPANLPSGNAGYSLFPITCDASHACVIAAATTTDLSTAVYAPIAFGPSTDHCPNPGPSAVFGTGAATAYRALYHWQSNACVAPYNLPMVYAVSNGIDGVNNFALGQQQANFGVTGPLPSSAFMLPATAPSYKVAPITGSAVVIAYKMYDRRGPQITNLTLTPYEIAQLFAPGITTQPLYTDPGVAFLNPGIEFPTSVQPFARAEHSSETWVFTSWLYATLGPGSWPMKAVTTWLPQNSVIEASGSKGVGEAVAGVNPRPPSIGQGTIGFMDSSTAAYYGLPTVKIRMPNGSIADAGQTSTVMKGLSLATQNADGTYTPDYTPTATDAYPMSIPSFMLVPTNQIDPSSGATLAAFLKYAVQQGQSDLPAGYVPLPGTMVSQSLDAASAIPVTAPAASSSSSGTAADSGFGNTGLGGAGLNDQLPLGSVGGQSRPPAQASSNAGNRCSSGAAACSSSVTGSAGGGQTASTLLVAGSGALAIVVAVAALAAFGVLTGPVTYFLARHPRLRQRLERLWPWRPAGGPTS